MQLIRKRETYQPISEIFKLFAADKDAAFLASSLQNSLGQYSIIGLNPYLKLVKGQQFTINGEPSDLNFEDYLRDYLEQNHQDNPTELPLVAGAIGYFSYEYGRQLQGVVSKFDGAAERAEASGVLEESVLTESKSDNPSIPQQPDLPSCILVFYDNFIIEDHIAQESYLVANGQLETCELSLDKLETRISELVTDSVADLAADMAADPVASPAAGPVVELNNESSVEVSVELSGEVSGKVNGEAGGEAGGGATGDAVNDASGADLNALAKTDSSLSAPIVTCNFDMHSYMDAIDTMVDYIVNGDIYVVNMTLQLQVQSDKKPYELFETLCQNNASPFGAYLNYGEFEVVCCSPERFLQMKAGHIVTRPIKGTRKRGATAKEDAQLRQELANSYKDQSELLMIVDLERNDLNRVCRSGSVVVSEMYSIEEYATVFHLVSTIEGQLRQDASPVDLLAATTPGGSITGAPKIRAMELIDQLERSPRGLYTGSLGFISLNGDCDLNINIRTAVHVDGVYYIGAGGGNTCESDSLFEYREALQKADALLKALGCYGYGYSFSQAETKLQ
jgi:para-aminobenzoate synthetase component 1